MHRWFIAIFALHFIMSVNAFSLEPVEPSAPALVALAPPPATESTAGPTGGKAATALPEPGAPHTLLDELPDLPDSLARTVATARPALVPASARAWLAELPPVRVPDTPLRPPRGVHG